MSNTSPPIQLSLKELIFAIFPIYDDDLHTARIAYSHFTSEHHTGLARQVISEPLAKSIIAADPDETLTHVQTYHLPGNPPFHVLWLKDEWLTSTERRKLQIAERIRRVAETEAKDQEAAWLRALAKSMSGAMYLPLDACVAKIQLYWTQHKDPRKMLAWVHAIEEMFSCAFWVEPPQAVNDTQTQKVTHEQETNESQDPRAPQAQDQADQGLEQEEATT